MADGAIAERTFGLDVHTAFASLSGDINPMHMDSVAARRTQVGAPVVHGIHTLLWAIDALASQPDCPSGLTSVQARFAKPNYVGDTATLTIAKRTPALVTLRVLVESATIATIKLGFDAEVAASPGTELPDPALVEVGEPTEIALAQLAGREGTVGYTTSLDAFAERFPAACRLAGPARVRGFAALSRLVGMECPGLHSIFGGLRVDFVPDSGRDVAYRVLAVDDRFGLVKMSVAGSGLEGEVDAFLRPAPTPQLTMAELAELVAPGEFAGHDVLVVGGSRGLGELAVKIAAAGGARTALTYAVGSADAELVAEEVHAFGGTCQALRYDATEPAAPQLEGLEATPTHVYYFATQRILGRKARLFEPELYRRFTDVYLTGFYELCAALAAGGEITALFPSSTFIDEQPEDFAEYVMAKSAGEALCRYMTLHMPKVTAVARRLPKVLTDQTASVMPAEMTPAIDVMLPLVREVQGGATG